MRISVQRILWIGAAAALAAGSASAQVISNLPALKPAIDELRTELSLTDQQVKDAEKLVIGQMARVQAAVDNFGGVSFDSILDVMVEARATREEFIPAVKNLLTEEQKAKLGKLPKAHGIYVSALAGWLTEAQLGKLKNRVGLTDAQLSTLRSPLLGQYKEAAGIIEGLIRQDEAGDDKSMTQTVLDAVLDLRGVQRMTEREIQKALTPEQKTRFDAYREESEKKSKGEK
jgi:hypothetical protein